MTEAEARVHWGAVRDELDRTPTASKHSMGAMTRLSAMSGGLPEPERAVATEEIFAWLHSDDGALRYDACFLINAHDLRAARPALRRLAGRQRSGAGCGACAAWRRRVPSERTMTGSSISRGTLAVHAPVPSFRARRRGYP